MYDDWLSVHFTGLFTEFIAGSGELQAFAEGSQFLKFLSFLKTNSPFWLFEAKKQHSASFMFAFAFLTVRPFDNKVFQISFLVSLSPALQSLR